MTGLNTSGRATVFQLLNVTLGRSFCARPVNGVTQVLVMAAYHGRQTLEACEILVELSFGTFVEALLVCRDDVNARIGGVMISVTVEEEIVHVVEQEELLPYEKAA